MGRLLSEGLAERIDGPWEFLATAAGVGAAVARTTEGLERAAIDAAQRDVLVSPSEVRDRVEALAAFDPQLIAQITERWIDPREIRGNDWWSVAWSSVLRHLDRIRALDPARVDVPDLREELKLLRPAPGGPVSWRTLSDVVRDDPFAYASARLYAAHTLADTVLTVDDLDAAPFVMLRVLRGRAAILDGRAREWLAALAEHAVDLHPLHATLVVETCLDLGVTDRAALERQVVERLPLVDPRNIAPLCYVLLGDWRLP